MFFVDESLNRRIVKSFRRFVVEAIQSDDIWWRSEKVGTHGSCVRGRFIDYGCKGESSTAIFFVFSLLGVVASALATQVASKMSSVPTRI